MIKDNLKDRYNEFCEYFAFSKKRFNSSREDFHVKSDEFKIYKKGCYMYLVFDLYNINEDFIEECVNYFRGSNIPFNFYIKRDYKDTLLTQIISFNLNKVSKYHSFYYPKYYWDNKQKLL